MIKKKVIMSETAIVQLQERIMAPAPASSSDNESVQASVLQLVNLSRRKLSPKFFYATKDAEANKEELKKALLTDGLVRFGSGYFRLTEDPENGNRVLLFSFNPDDLRGELDDKANVKINKNSEVFYVSSHAQGTSGETFYEDMTQFKTGLQKAVLSNLSLSGSIAQTDGDQPTEIELTNGRINIAISECDIKLSGNILGDIDPTGTFIKEADGSFHVRNTDSIYDNLQLVQRYWAQAAKKQLHGELLFERDPKKWVKNLRSDIANKFNAGMSNIVDGGWTAYLSLAIIGVGVRTAGFVLEGISWDNAGKFATQVSIGIATLFGTKPLSDMYFAPWLSKVFGVKEKQIQGQLVNTSAAPDLANKYLENTPENKIRTLKTVDPESLKRLNLLSYNESGMNYDENQNNCVTDDPTANNEVLNNDIIRRAGTILIKTGDQDLLALMPSGLIRSSHVDSETGDVKNYYGLDTALSKETEATLQQAVIDSFKDNTHPPLIQTSFNKSKENEPNRSSGLEAFSTRYGTERLSIQAFQTAINSTKLTDPNATFVSTVINRALEPYVT